MLQPSRRPEQVGAASQDRLSLDNGAVSRILCIMDRVGIADFLRRHRHALRPEDVGLEGGRRRRTAGLRREEVAALAKISTDFYTRLEQRRGPRPSVQTVDAMARALRLTHDEHDHLRRLAGHEASPRVYRNDVPSPGLVRVLEHLQAPAQIVSDLGVALKQNSLARALRGVQTNRNGLERSFIYRWFIGPEERRRIVDEDHDALSRLLTAYLRAIHSRSAADVEVVSLVTELCRRSREFARRWDEHEVAVVTKTPERIRHPVVGVIAFETQLLTFQYQTVGLVVFTAAPNSEDAERLAFLAARVRKMGSTR